MASLRVALAQLRSSVPGALSQAGELLGTNLQSDAVELLRKLEPTTGVPNDRLGERFTNDTALAEVALAIKTIIEGHKVRDWQHKGDVHNRIRNDIDELFHELKGESEVFILTI